MHVFVSQVTFSAESANEELVKSIMKKKVEAGVQWKGFLVSSVWRQEKSGEVSYTWTLKWETKEDFKSWMSRPEHVAGHKKMNQLKQSNAEKPLVKKTVNQYDEISPEFFAG